MKVADLVSTMEELAPTSRAAEWDNVGLLVGDPDRAASRVLLAIDLTPDVQDEAREGSFDAVIAYHPPIFRPLKRILAGTLAWDFVRSGVAIYSPHTALDVAAGGTNDVLADALGLGSRAPLRPSATDPSWGMGRIGARDAIARRDLVAHVKRELGVSAVLVAGPEDGDVTHAAACAGSCGDLLDDALRARVDVYLTGELRHHDALRAAAAGTTVICTLHSNSERATLRRLARKLHERHPDVTFETSRTDRDPFVVA